MKKKIIFGLSVLVTALIIVIILVVFLPNRDKEISISGYKQTDELYLGKYKIKNYSSRKYMGEYETISFDVSDANDFYNKIIKENEFYQSNLDFDVDIYFAYGFIIKNYSLFNYTISEDNKVTLTSNYFYYIDLEGNGSTDSYIFAPGTCYIDKDTITENIKNFENSELKYDMYFYNLDFNQLSIIYSYVPNLCLIEEDTIYVKGISLDTDSNELNISDDYLIKIYELDGYLVIDNI